eukprot:TRINITY_DN5235_c0_g1_i1.p1 TRINITY_DN5235_c0_g1~~TRINITY_DN5235_c0_g1_i1.p1  ORF type:complete len:939 (+),score=250.47 TRINITY_DN5235_c0_g1_i1:44-2860(+)
MTKGRVARPVGRAPAGESYPARLRAKVAASEELPPDDGPRRVSSVFWHKVKLQTGIGAQRLKDLTMDAWSAPADMPDSTARSFGDYDPAALLDFAKSCAAKLGLQRAVAELAARLHRQQDVVSGADLRILQSDADLEAGVWPRPADDKGRRQPGRKVTDADTRSQLMKLKQHFIATIAPLPDDHGAEAPSWADAASLLSLRHRLQQQSDALREFGSSQSWRQLHQHGVHDFNLNKRHAAATARVLKGEREVSIPAVRDHFAALYLQRERIEVMDEGLLEFKGLRELRLSGNLLTAVENTPPGLLQLHCCGNRIREVHPGGLTSNIVHLGLAYNELEDLGFLVRARKGGGAANLSSLDVGFNRLWDIDAAAAACEELPRLQRVFLRGNPLALVPAYRPYLVRRLLQLKGLDDDDVRSEERRIHVYAPDERAALMVQRGRHAHHWLPCTIASVLGGDRYAVEVLPNEVASAAGLDGAQSVSAVHLRKWDPRPQAEGDGGAEAQKEDPKKKAQKGARKSVSASPRPSAPQIAPAPPPEEEREQGDDPSGLTRVSICVELRQLVGLFLEAVPRSADPPGAGKGKAAPKPAPKAKGKSAAPASDDEVPKREVKRAYRLVADEPFLEQSDRFETPLFAREQLQPAEGQDPDPSSLRAVRGVLPMRYVHCWRAAPSRLLADRLSQPWCLSLVEVSEEYTRPSTAATDGSGAIAVPEKSESTVLGKLFVDLGVLRATPAPLPQVGRAEPTTAPPSASGSRPASAATAAVPAETTPATAPPPLLALRGARVDAEWVPNPAAARLRKRAVIRPRAVRAACAAALVAAVVGDTRCLERRGAADDGDARPATVGSQGGDAAKDGKKKGAPAKGAPQKQQGAEPTADDMLRRLAAMGEEEDRLLADLEHEAALPQPRVQLSVYLYLNAKPQPPAVTAEQVEDKKGAKPKKK